MTSRTNKLRGLLTLLEEHTAGIHDEVSNGGLDVEAAVTVGRLLTLIVKQANAALDPLKESLREATITQTGGSPGHVTFKGAEGASCIVVIPQPTLTLRKDADVSKIKAALGDRFSDYFSETVVYAPQKDFRKVATAHPQEAITVMPAVDIIEGTPRVSFRD